MGRARDEESLRISSEIIDQVGKRPCLYDSEHPNNRNRRCKNDAWEEVCRVVVPGWSTLVAEKKAEEGRKVQGRWRSIRDCYTKSFKQGAHVGADVCPQNSRRFQKHLKMKFLRDVLIKKDKRSFKENHDKSSDISKTFIDKSSDISKTFIEDTSTNSEKDRFSSSPQLKMPSLPPSPIPFIFPKYEINPEPLNLSIKKEPIQNCNDIEHKSVISKEKITKDQAQCTNSIFTETKESQTVEMFENVKIEDINPEDDLTDDRLFMERLLPTLKNMEQTMKLQCRMQMIKLIKNVLEGKRLGVKQEKVERTEKPKEATLSMTTRSADGSRPSRKRKIRSPSPSPNPIPKKRGPGRPRKIRPSEPEELPSLKKRSPRLKVVPVEVPKLSALELRLSKATSLADLSTQEFMKVWNLQRAKTAPPVLQTPFSNIIKEEPKSPS